MNMALEHSSLAKTMVAVAIAAAAGLACGTDPVEQQGDPRITLFPDSIAVGVYTSSLPLSAALHNGTGTIQFVSRDPGVATVNASGAVHGVAIGSTRVVATLLGHPDVRDSVSVRVHADSCSGARPDFGGLATAADRALFSYDANAPLNFQKAVEGTVNGVEVSNIAYSSPDGGLVNGMMWVPLNRPGLRPGMVLMHGLPGNATNTANVAQSYAQMGAVAIAISAPWNRRTGQPFTFTVQDRFEQIQVIKDLQRAVDVLRSLPQVDDERIAYDGRSWGGATGALFVGIERRLKTAVLIVGHSGQVSLATGPDGYLLGTGLSCAVRAAWIRAMTPIEPIRFVGAAGIPLLLQNGTLDELVPTANAAELHAAAQQPKEVRWYEAGHSLNQQASIDRINWLIVKIGLEP